MRYALAMPNREVGKTQTWLESQAQPHRISARRDPEFSCL
jgi:hypothetical protein